MLTSDAQLPLPTLPFKAPMATAVPTSAAPTPGATPIPAVPGLPDVDWSSVNLVTFAWHLGLAILIVLAGRWLAKIARRWVRRGLTKVTLTESVAQLLERIAYYGIILGAVLVALTVVGVPTTGILYTVGIVLVIFGVALQESLSSFAATVIFLTFQPFKVGELIETNGVMGTVREIALFNTILTKADNKILVLPNAQIQNSVLVNYSRLSTLRADLKFNIGYGDDLRKAKQVLESMLANDPRVLPQPPALVVVQELGDNAVQLAVRPWVKNEDYWKFQTDFVEQVKLRFDTEGITFPFPQRDVHLYPVGDRPITEQEKAKSSYQPPGG